MRFEKPTIRQKGAALILVLWVALFLSVLLAGTLATTRIQTKTTRASQEILKARLAAEAAMDLTAYEIAHSGRNRQALHLPTTKTIGDHEITIDWSGEMTKTDLNLASESSLAALFVNKEIDHIEADKMAAQIADWRDRDDLSRPNGAEARAYIGLSQNKIIGNRPFLSVSELNYVLDITPEIFSCVVSELTVFGTNNPTSRPNIVTAGNRITLSATVQSNNSNRHARSWQSVYLIDGRRERGWQKIITKRDLSLSYQLSCP